MEVVLSQAGVAWRSLRGRAVFVEAASFGTGRARSRTKLLVALLASWLLLASRGVLPKAKPQCQREHLRPEATVGIKIAEMIKQPLFDTVLWSLLPTPNDKEASCALRILWNMAIQLAFFYPDFFV